MRVHYVLLPFVWFSVLAEATIIDEFRNFGRALVGHRSVPYDPRMFQLPRTAVTNAGRYPIYVMVDGDRVRISQATSNIGFNAGGDFLEMGGLNVGASHDQNVHYQLVHKARSVGFTKINSGSILNFTPAMSPYNMVYVSVFADFGNGFHLIASSFPVQIGENVIVGCDNSVHNAARGDYWIDFSGTNWEQRCRVRGRG
ncbi:hypothetical protein L596_025828 [Steinernema carpocapsae]|uniref:Uncharacterized protein n=1 Tax=Steinernema carpocapsae TaxID=34508 RepID=A0A4U5MA70_STECR|nr:hypothetical protein L596_025828 [Steinernema carpocapsae]